MVVTMQAWLSLCQNCLHCHQRCLPVCKFITVLMVVVHLAILTCCDHVGIVGIVVILPVWMSSCLHGCHHVRIVCIVNKDVYLLASLSLSSWRLSICSFQLVVILLAVLSSCQNGFHHVRIVCFVSKAIYVLASLSLFTL